MIARVIVVLPGVGTLDLSREAYEAALRPLTAVPAPKVTEAPIQSLLTARAVAAALSLPESWIREKERQGEIPSIRASRYVRFDLEAVRTALSKTVNGASGRG